MSLEVILNTPEIAILGPPDSIDVQLDIGPQGIRGSRIYSGVGEPASNPALTDVRVFDFYLRTDPSGAGYLYQYLAGVTGVPQWTVVFQLDPVIYNARESVLFSSGTATIDIPIYFILGSFDQTIDLSDLHVVFSPEYSRPVVISLLSKTKVNNNTDLRLQFIAKEYNTSLEDWVDTDNNVTLNYSISVTSITDSLVPPSS